MGVAAVALLPCSNDGSSYDDRMLLLLLLLHRFELMTALLQLRPLSSLFGLLIGYFAAVC